MPTAHREGTAFERTDFALHKGWTKSSYPALLSRKNAQGQIL
ncbi:hypothetical protein CLOSTMETH_01957 [[Clostridium] methylpentosum DSM 5476]|uniref:Uncharacterized protein n=1 Tax=[Clostridium] methylpentosum DSM 5476 TaxID=537013 RepID=C0EDM9_9FIRM|nr:hypothetical protein CLOSTMETH_01957 [[Clostridium] methylpentosum DSM 5476]